MVFRQKYKLQLKELYTAKRTNCEYFSYILFIYNVKIEVNREVSVYYILILV